MRYWARLRCMFGFHYWPDIPTSRTFGKNVYVCTNTSCLYVKATDA